MKPPIAKKTAFAHKMHGDVRCDPYHWIRDPDWQTVMKSPDALQDEIRTYLDAENAYTRWAMADTVALQTALFDEMKGRIQEEDSSVPFPDGAYEYFWRYRTGGQHLVYCRRAMGETDRDQVLVDGDALSRGHAYFDIGGFGHSPDHRFVAYGTDTSGSEYHSLHFVSAADGVPLPEVIPDTDGSCIWSADSTWLFYVRLDDHHRPSRVYRHRLGTDARDDVLVYEEPDPSFFVDVRKTESGEFVLIDIHDHQTSEVLTIPADRPADRPAVVAPRETGVEYFLSHRGDTFLILTNADGAEDFKIVETGVRAPQRSNWTDVVAHKAGRLILRQIAYKDFHVRLERENALPRIVVSRVDAGGTFCDDHTIALTESAYDLDVSFGFEFDTPLQRYTYSSPTTPRQTYDYDMGERSRTLRKTQTIPSGHDPDDYRTERIEIESNGVFIPVTLLYRTAMPPAPERPLLLYGYGSYGHSIPASFAGNRLSLVDRGVTYAIAHVRGGQEKGYRWYRDGKLEAKKHTFEDFIAVARGLIKRGYTSPGSIVAHGGSAGGLLIGAVANMAPDLFAGMIGDVPFVDTLTTICDSSLPLTPPEWSEWGNPIENRDVYFYMKAYSPYDNVAEKAYPPILATGGLTDPRVTYWEPAKWIAKLRATKTDDNVCLLKINMDAGHAGAAGRFDYLKDVAFNYAFALKIIEGSTAGGKPEARWTESGVSPWRSDDDGGSDEADGSAD